MNSSLIKTVGPLVVPVVLGPTAVGKTGIALRLARDLDREIISCDSRQIYRYMNIATAKPSPDQLSGVKHWLVDCCDPSEHYSAYAFSRDALRILMQSNGRAIICGGTGYYFKCLVEGIAPATPTQMHFRREYEKKVHAGGTYSIFNELKAVDPESAGKIHPHDIRRIIRALEVYYFSGRKRSDLPKESQPPEHLHFCVIKVSLPRCTLYDRINSRVDQMFENGLWHEFTSLIKRGYSSESAGMQCVGYKEFFEVLNNNITLESALEQIKRNTRRYAKRQISWFKHQVEGTEFDLSTCTYADILAQVKNAIESGRNDTRRLLA
ncbi:MAG: tRNA (adenosine(37)-N6)-dimethylallyltransferase MiaA [Chitinivibrionales bacterium]|nr:tRNA (adenosine(37)-N6)-dimethylallyltransferase MiaA [Chitinivibrionales bacterium]